MPFEWEKMWHFLEHEQTEKIRWKEVGVGVVTGSVAVAISF